MNLVNLVETSKEEIFIKGNKVMQLLKENYKVAIIGGVSSVALFIGLTVLFSNKTEQPIQEQIIEPAPLSVLEEQLNFDNEDAIFFKPSNNSTQSVQVLTP